MPLPRGGLDLSPRIRELQEMAAKAGRAPIPVTIFFAPPDIEQLRAFENLGVGRCLFHLPSAEEDVILPKLDELAGVVAQDG